MTAETASIPEILHLTTKLSDKQSATRNNKIPIREALPVGLRLGLRTRGNVVKVHTQILAAPIPGGKGHPNKNPI